MDIEGAIKIIQDRTLQRHLVIGVDMDGTLTQKVCWSEAECESALPNLAVVAKVNALRKRHYVIIYTARGDELIPATLRWLRKHDVYFIGISNHKQPMDMYLDDRSFNPCITGNKA